MLLVVVATGAGRRGVVMLTTCTVSAVTSGVGDGAVVVVTTSGVGGGAVVVVTASGVV